MTMVRCDDRAYAWRMLRGAFLLLLITAGCAQVTEEGQTVEAGAETDPLADGATKEAASIDAVVDAAVDAKSNGCWAESRLEYCWKCCSNVASLEDGMRAFYAHAFACYCDTHSAAQCDRTCSLAKFSPTPDEECVPFFRDGVAKCESSVPQEERATYDAYIACIQTCR